MDEERDSIVFEDEEGNEIELDILDYFFYEDQEYAILMDLSGVPEEQDGADDEVEPQDIYIMKVVANGDMEEFLPVEDELMDKLSEIAESRLFAEDDEEDDDEDDEE